MFDIPKGFGTKLGVGGAALLAVVSALTPFISGADSGDTRFFAALSSALAAVTILGRMMQAAAQLISVPSPAQTGDLTDPDDWSDDDVEPDVPLTAPSNDQLADHYPDDIPAIGGKAGETS